MVIIYGIPNCGTVKKALAWAKDHGVEHTFEDLRKTPPEVETLNRWIAAAGLDKLVNKRSTAWRSIPPEERVRLEADPAAMRDKLRDLPTLIKRPVIVYPDGAVTVGVIELRL